MEASDAQVKRHLPQIAIIGGFIGLSVNLTRINQAFQFYYI